MSTADLACCITDRKKTGLLRYILISFKHPLKMRLPLPLERSLFYAGDTRSPEQP